VAVVAVVSQYQFVAVLDVYRPRLEPVGSGDRLVDLEEIAADDIDSPGVGLRTVAGAWPAAAGVASISREVSAEDREIATNLLLGLKVTWVASCQPSPLLV